MTNEICDHFGLCGGCSRQDQTYTEQLASKDKLVRIHLSGLPVERWHPIVPSPQTTYYRNKMEYAFGDRRDIEILGRPKGEKGPSPVVPPDENVVHLGLHPKGRFALVTPTPDCRLMSPEAQRLLELVGSWANEWKVSIYLRRSGEGDLRHLVIREGKNTGERLVNLVARSTTPRVKELAGRIEASGIPVTTFLFSAYDGLSDVAVAGDRRVMWGEGAIQEHLGRLRFTVTPSSFMQTNTRAAERMVEILRVWAAEDAASLPRRALVDLYCGAGTIGLNLAAGFDEMIGVEIHPEAVREARKTALDNGIRNARFFEGKAEEVAAQLPVSDRAAGTTVVVDPPRAGLHARVVKTLLEWAAPRLYYVSCNPESLARDLRLLVERYSIDDVQPMDFFPHTDHIETAVRLTLKPS